MKRGRTKRHSGLGRSADKLIRMAGGLSDSSCRLEGRYWAQQLNQLVEDLIQHGEEDVLNSTLDYLYRADNNAYEALADHIESCAETNTTLFPENDILLIAAPILVWSRYRIPTATIPPAILANLRSHLKTHILATDTKLALANILFSPDQLPQGYCPTSTFTSLLGKAAQDNLNLHIDANTLGETAQFLSDIRYILASIATPKNHPLFRWQDSQSNRTQALTLWRNHATTTLSSLLPGCTLEVVLPEAYFSACRAADYASRPYAIRASVAFLSATLGAPASELRAIIALFRDQQQEEYRIGFTLPDQNEIVYGIVWPLLGAEEDSSEDPSQIENTLRECNVNNILTLAHPFPLEYCDDCGTPLYPTPEGELIHAEMPETHGDIPSLHLH